MDRKVALMRFVGGQFEFGDSAPQEKELQAQRDQLRRRLPWSPDALRGYDPAPMSRDLDNMAPPTVLHCSRGSRKQDGGRGGYASFPGVGPAHHAAGGGVQSL